MRPVSVHEMRDGSSPRTPPRAPPPESSAGVASSWEVALAALPPAAAGRVRNLAGRGDCSPADARRLRLPAHRRLRARGLGAQVAASTEGTRPPDCSLPPPSWHGCCSPGPNTPGSEP
ncbi:hypothetical protein QJS66_09045 [Kocuria rhizophila]|nr:hypothetical protein QJS66_09045 [Kocuria rhizophila]